MSKPRFAFHGINKGGERETEGTDRKCLLLPTDNNFGVPLPSPSLPRLSHSIRPSFAKVSRNFVPGSFSTTKPGIYIYIRGSWARAWIPQWKNELGNVLERPTLASFVAGSHPGFSYLSGFSLVALRFEKPTALSETNGIPTASLIYRPSFLFFIPSNKIRVSIVPKLKSNDN